MVIELCVVQFWSEIILHLKLPLRACSILKSGQTAPQLAQLPLFIRIFVIAITIVTIIITVTIIIVIIITIICIIISTFSR